MDAVINVANRARLERICSELFNMANSYAGNKHGYIACRLHGISNSVYSIRDTMEVLYPLEATPPTPCSTCNGTGKLPWTHPAVKKQVLDINNPEVEDEYPCPDPQHGRDVKPLAQYLAEYLATGIDRTHKAGMPVDFTEEGLKLVLEQALDAYQSTENVTIKIERV